MRTTLYDGIPTHVLFAHFVVVLTPLTALALVVCALWPSVIRRFGLALPALALVALVIVPFTTSSGQWLEGQVRENSYLTTHAEAGDDLLPWAVALFVLAVALWWVYRRGTATAAPGVATVRERAGEGVRMPLRVAAVLVCLVMAAGALVEIYDIGHSGAKATWHKLESPGRFR
ncbi:DUF2231 domain-containing protein [Streptomyces abikoensis]|uniref:DUF2231 domain-containing protein n=1 Tax=Streptomyces abikoensis TaxID=97398 RepID=UPI00167514B9|nr:DUF2231 domain-containing protein [Streptomyces abikoensis]GGP36898.1 hypothetical protein GCM10010214_07370 [Streptomyces abikoensis]